MSFCCQGRIFRNNIHFTTILLRLLDLLLHNHIMTTSLSHTWNIFRALHSRPYGSFHVLRAYGLKFHGSGLDVSSVRYVISVNFVALAVFSTSMPSHFISTINGLDSLSVKFRMLAISCVIRGLHFRSPPISALVLHDSCVEIKSLTHTKLNLPHHTVILVQMIDG